MRFTRIPFRTGERRAPEFECGHSEGFNHDATRAKETRSTFPNPRTPAALVMSRALRGQTNAGARDHRNQRNGDSWPGGRPALVVGKRNAPAEHCWTPRRGAPPAGPWGRMPYAWCLAPSWYFTRLLGRYERGRTQEPRTSQRRKPSVRPGAARDSTSAVCSGSNQRRPSRARSKKRVDTDQRHNDSPHGDGSAPVICHGQPKLEITSPARVVPATSTSGAVKARSIGKRFRVQMVLRSSNTLLLGARI